MVLLLSRQQFSVWPLNNEIHKDRVVNMNKDHPPKHKGYKKQVVYRYPM